jgi:hypothetical protein
MLRARNSHVLYVCVCARVYSCRQELFVFICSTILCFALFYLDSVEPSGPSVSLSPSQSVCCDVSVPFTHVPLYITFDFKYLISIFKCLEGSLLSIKYLTFHNLY